MQIDDLGGPKGHPDWWTQKEKALFEAHIGKLKDPERYLICSYKNQKELPIEERIKRDIDQLEQTILKGITPKIILTPRSDWCQESKIYRLK